MDKHGNKLPAGGDIHAAKLARIAALQAERNAEARGERVYGAPLRSFESIAKESI